LCQNKQMSIDYPIKFIPILHERIWGGEKLHTLLGKKAVDKPIGESWEISTVPNSVSVVANGNLKGKNLQELIDTYTSDLVGVKVFEKYGTDFPLLVKFIDAKTDLSVQLHPNDMLAQKRHNSFGKEEMWYIMQADLGSKLMFGFKEKLTKKVYLEHLKNNTLAEILHYENVKKGDIFHIPTGRVHAIGAGVLLAEIQQSSDVTYRLYDWDRKNANGKTRELHTDLALDAIDFNLPKYFKTPYDLKPNLENKVVETSYFTTYVLVLDTKKEMRQNKDSFTIYMCIAGEAVFKTGKDEVIIKTGESVFIPAALEKYCILPTHKVTLLQTS